MVSKQWTPSNSGANLSALVVRRSFAGFEDELTSSPLLFFRSPSIFTAAACLLKGDGDQENPSFSAQRASNELKIDIDIYNSWIELKLIEREEPFAAELGEVAEETCWERVGVEGRFIKGGKRVSDWSSGEDSFLLAWEFLLVSAVACCTLFWLFPGQAWN